MYGANMGTLRVDYSNGGQAWSGQWGTAGNKGQAWFDQEVNIPAGDSQVKVRVLLASISIPFRPIVVLFMIIN